MHFYERALSSIHVGVRITALLNSGGPTDLLDDRVACWWVDIGTMTLHEQASEYVIPYISD